MARLLRFVVSSLLATLVSAAVFPVVYQGGGPRLATLAAFGTGALVGFVVNRSWTWKGRDRTMLGRDIFGYAVVACSLAALAAVATTVTDRYTTRAGIDRATRTVLVECAYLGTYLVMFGVKFVVLDRWVFRARDPRARQV
jgi:putative flippase GtrA